MPLYIADYLSDTRRLSAAQHGAYLLLIMEYWQTGGKLPSNATALARLASMTESEWADAEPIIASFFEPGWRHPRIDDELAKAAEKLAKRSAAGKKGGNAKAANLANVKQTSSNATSNALALNSSNALASSSHTHSKPNGLEAREEIFETRKRGSRIPEDFEPDLGEALVHGLNLPAATKEAANFKDYWRAKPGAAGVKLDWEATWRVWCRRAAGDTIMGPAAPTTPAEPMVWLTEDSPDWQRAASLYHDKTGKTPRASGSRHESGVGFYFPAGLLEATQMRMGR